MRSPHLEFCLAAVSDEEEPAAEEAGKPLAPSISFNLSILFIHHLSSFV